MSERAVFVTQAKAAQAAQRLRFIKQDANFKPHYERGEMQGYTVAYQDSTGWHVCTEKDVGRFGL
jgi:hypothetical protein